MNIITIPVVKNNKTFKFGDMLIYGTIKAMTFNGQAQIPTTKIINQLNISKPTFYASVKRLIDSNLISIDKNKTYCFKEPKLIENFSSDFILSKELSNGEKEFLIRIQNLFFGKPYPKVLISMNNTKLTKYCKISKPTLLKIKTSLKEKGILTDETKDSFCIDTNITKQYEVLKKERDLEMEGILYAIGPDCELEKLKSLLLELAGELHRAKEKINELENSFCEAS